MRGRLTLAAIALLLAPTLARAQMGGNAQMSYEAVTRAPAGAWADYQVSLVGAGAKNSLKMRYALVARTAKQIALEIVSQTPMGDMTVRLEFTPEPPDAWKLTHARMKMGDSPAEDMPPPPSTLKAGDTVGDLVGKETLATPAGPLPCTHYRRKTPDGAFDFWMNDKVLPIGLVKMADSRVSVVLQKTGNGAGPTLK